MPRGRSRAPEKLGPAGRTAHRLGRGRPRPVRRDRRAFERRQLCADRRPAATTAGVGAAWAFLRSGETWGQAGGKLTAGEGAEAEVGSSVALSASATTALLGARFAHVGAGAAYVFQSGRHSPTVVTGEATNLTATSAVLNATVDPNGEEVTSCEFE